MNKRTKITLTATPKDGYRFISWSNGVTANPYTTTVGNIIAQENRIEPIYTSESSSDPIIDCAYNEIRYINNTKIILNYTNDYCFYSNIISHSFNETIHEGIITFSHDISYIPDCFISTKNTTIQKIYFPQSVAIIGRIPVKINTIKATNQNLRFTSHTNEKDICNADYINMKSPYLKAWLANDNDCYYGIFKYDLVYDGGFSDLLKELKRNGLLISGTIPADYIICSDNIISFWEESELNLLNALQSYYVNNPNKNYSIYDYRSIYTLENNIIHYNSYNNWQVSINA